MLVVAIVGIVVNLAATRVLAGSERRSLNVEGAFQHVLTDLFAFIATAIAGAVVLLTGFSRADGIAALVRGRADAALGLRPAARLRPRAARGGAARPRPGGDRQRCSRRRTTWWRCTTCTCGRSPPASPRISAHVTVRAGCDTQAHRRELAELLRERFGISHSTLQVETRHEGPLTIEPLERGTGRECRAS